SKTNAAFFTFSIRTAIYFRAAAAIISRVMKTALLPILDFLLIYIGMYFLKEYWSQTAFVQYPQEFMFYVVPAYSIIWILSIYLSGGYDAPIRLSKIVRGLFVGTVFIL